jgi:16S rRNA (cytosine967-C5)-methyltransferase
MKPEIQTKMILTKILAEIFEHKNNLTHILPLALSKITDHRDKALVQFCAYEICRDYLRLDAMIKKLVAKPLKDKNAYYLLLIGLSQLNSSRMPAYAVVSSTVEAAKKLKLFSLANLINAVLREFQRQQATLVAQLDQNPITQYSHPEWLIKLLQTAWPEQWHTICAENNKKPPLWLRINAIKTSPEAYLEMLHQNNIEVSAVYENACCLTTAVDVEQLPGFEQGLVSVQDRAAQMAAELLDLQAGQRVLDACAAPGGKTGHILEKQAQLQELLSIDNDPQRIHKIQENLTRLQLTANVALANALCPKEWWDGVLFDRILLDAPCSATGVIRRHPDIKVLRQAHDIQELAQQQLALLKALWPLLKPEGKFLYATCSVLPQENQNIVKQFCQENPDAEVIPFDRGWGTAVGVGRQILPGEQNMDGFFYALLIKKTIQ